MAYWRRCLPDLYEAYGGVCAYTAFRIPKPLGLSTVDHYVPCSRSPGLAYEWSNYRLASHQINTNKKVHEVLDPFGVEQGWFVPEDIFSMEIGASAELTEALRAQVEDTIQKLRLNSTEWVELRQEYFDSYISGHVDLLWLRRNSPFLAFELERQGL